jgi:hypothetical protein
MVISEETKGRYEALRYENPVKVGKFTSGKSVMHRYFRNLE